MRARLLITVAVMALAATPLFSQPKICFPPHEGLPGHGGIPPTIDGYIDRAVGYATSEPPETGWVRSSLVTYGPGSTVPVASFQGLKDNAQPFLYLGFTLNFDPTFDDNDVIVLVIRPTVGNAHTAQERRIDIYPLVSGVGAGPAGPDDAVGAMGGSHIRTNRDPRNVEYYRWDMGSNQYVALAGNPTNLSIKVRSWSNLADTERNWSVEVKLPLTTALGGADWIDINPQFSFYYNVIRACNGSGCTGTALESGYTTQFVWPEPNGINGILTDATNGEHATLAEYEVMPGWLGQADIGTGVGDCQGVHFEGGVSGVGVRNPGNPTGPLLSSIDSLATNKFIARVVNDGTAAANNVRAEFRIANWGVGGGPGVWDTIPPPAGGQTAPATIPNTNTRVELDKDWLLTAAQRTALQPGGTLAPHQCMWVLLSSVSNVFFTEGSVRRNMDFTNLSGIKENADISGRGYKDKPRSGKYSFLLTANQRFLTMFPPALDMNPLEARKMVERTVKYPRGAAVEILQPLKDKRDNVLLTERERILFATQAGGSMYPVTDWIWVVNAYRRTPFVLTMGKKKYPIYDAVGAFGREGFHVGDVQAFNSKISGGDLKPITVGTYVLQVPYGKSARILTVTEAADAKERERNAGKVIPERTNPKR